MAKKCWNYGQKGGENMQWFEKMATLTAVLKSVSKGDLYEKVLLTDKTAAEVRTAIESAGVSVRSIEIAILSRISDGECVNLAAVGNAVLRLIGND